MPANSHFQRAGVHAASILPRLGLPVLGLVLWSAGVAGAPAQSSKSKSGVKPPPPTVEAGLEQAVKWKWQVAPSDAAAWGLSLDAAPVVTTTGPGGKVTSSAPTRVALAPPENSFEYIIEKGDSFTRISKKFGVSIDHLKLANKKKDDRIIVGDPLHIPSMAEIQELDRAARASAPPPSSAGTPAGSPAAAGAPPAPSAGSVVVNTAGQGTPGASGAKSQAPPVRRTVQRQLPEAAISVGSVVLVQAYLDRKHFSAGPIDGSEGPLYEGAVKAFEAVYPGNLQASDGDRSKALNELGGAYTEYQLRREDLRWIGVPATPAKRGSSSTGTPDPTFQELTSGRFLPYRSAWEFVAERFHCSESFLRRINPGIKSNVAVGAVYVVPNVEPFEIENALNEPLQPPADPAAPVTARIVNNSRLEIRKGDKIIAYLPVSAARPGLRGRGTWRVLDALPRPSLVSTGELANPPKVTGPDIGTGALVPGSPQAVTVAPAVPAGGSYTIPPGPNNPLGLLWLNLAKGAETTPLPYGLHGTSIPGLMTRLESLGGFRMTNWDIARAVRLIPAGTPITWQ